MNTIIRVSPSGPELIYPLLVVGNSLTVQADGTVAPTGYTGAQRILVSPSGPELTYPASEAGKVLTVQADGTVAPVSNVVQFFAGDMSLSARSGAETPLPEYALIPGPGYETLPEAVLDVQKFELTVYGTSGLVNVKWCDERHVGTHNVPVVGTGTVVANVLTATLNYGVYQVVIHGTIAGLSFSGSVLTTAGTASETYLIASATQVSTLTFPVAQYFSVAEGNDLNDGASLATPKRTLPAPQESGEYVLARRSRWAVNDNLGSVSRQFNVYGRGVGFRPILDQFIAESVFADETGGAWSCQVTATMIIDTSNPGRSTLIENGEILKQVADLAAVRLAPGSFATIGAFNPSGTVTIYFKPTSSDDPNTNGKLYEACGGELCLTAQGSPIFDSVICRGNTNNAGPIATHQRSNVGADNALIINCVAAFGKKHCLGFYGGMLEDLITLKCQSSTYNQGCSHIVCARVGNDVSQTNFTLRNVGMIGQPNGVVFGESGVLLEVQAGIVPMGNVKIDKLYSAFLSGSLVSQTLVPTSCVIDDMLLERPVSTLAAVLSSGKFVLNRPRVYDLAPYSPGQLLTDTTTQSFETHDGLYVSGQPPAGTGQGFINLRNSTNVANPMELIAENNTFVRIGAPTNLTPLLEVNCSVGNLYGDITWNHNAISGYGFGWETTGATTITPQPNRLSCDYNSWGNYVNAFDYGFSHIGATFAPFAVFAAGVGIWPASDAHSVAAAVTFSDTAGRYPNYTKTSAGPGGHSAPFVDPNDYLGVQFITTLEAAGQYPL